MKRNRTDCTFLQPPTEIATFVPAACAIGTSFLSCSAESASSQYSEYSDAGIAKAESREQVRRHRYVIQRTKLLTIIKNVEKRVIDLVGVQARPVGIVGDVHWLLRGRLAR